VFAVLHSSGFKTPSKICAAMSCSFSTLSCKTFGLRTTNRTFLIGCTVRSGDRDLCLDKRCCLAPAKVNSSGTDNVRALPFPFKSLPFTDAFPRPLRACVSGLWRTRGGPSSLPSSSSGALRLLVREPGLESVCCGILEEDAIEGAGEAETWI